MDELAALKEVRAAVPEPGPAAVAAARATLLATLTEEPEPRPRRQRRRLIIAAALAGVVALLAGTVVGLTGWGGSGAEEVRVGSSSPPLPPQPSPVTGPTNFLGSWTYSSVDPIDDFLSAHGGGQAAFLQTVGSAVARCMQAEGWSYQSTASTEQGYGSGDGPTNPIALEQYREADGYGYLVPTPNASLSPGQAAAESGEAAAAANNAYEALLSPADRARYLADLGALPVDDPASKLAQEFNNAVRAAGHAAPSPGPPAGSGCLGTAYAAEEAVYPPLPNGAQAQLAAALGTIAKDPSMVAAQAAWSGCMSAKGFHFSKERQAQSSISAYFGEEMANGGAPPPGLAAKQAQELATASADAQCAIETVWPVQSRLGFAAVQKVIRQYGRLSVCGTSGCVVPEQ